MNPANADEATNFACPQMVTYKVSLEVPGPEWGAQTEDKFAAQFTDLQLYDGNGDKRKLLLPENGDQPMDKKLPLTWKTGELKELWMECHYKAGDAAPGMGAVLSRSLPLPLGTCTSQPDGQTSGMTLTCSGEAK